MDNLHNLFIIPDITINTTGKKLNEFLALLTDRYGKHVVKCKGMLRGITWTRDKLSDVVYVSTYEIE